MNSFKVFVLIGLVACLSNQVNSLSCKNEKNEDVDWFVLLKPPKEKHVSPHLSTGGGYGFIDSNSNKAGWTLSDFDIGNPDSYIGKTFKEVYANPEKYSYVQYNDAKVEEASGSDSTIYAHAKGAIVWDNQNTVFIAHSTPKFLPIFHLKKYEYPETGKTHGQNFMCVTFDTKENINKLLEHLVTMKAQVYANHISKQLNNEISGLIQENINILAKIVKSDKNELPKGKKVDNERIIQLTANLKSKKGAEITLISKSRKDNVDIWSKIVSKALDAKELAVKTWTLLQKAASLLSSTCSRTERILNVLDMDVNFLNSEHADWGRNDHSKWGLCMIGGNNCYCQGDMNRATSQQKRGGGAMCLHDRLVHETFKNSFSSQYSCNNKLQKNKERL